MKNYQWIKWFENREPRDRCGVLDVSGEAEPLGYKNLLFSAMILSLGMVASVSFLALEHAGNLFGVGRLWEEDIRLKSLTKIY